MSSVAFVGELPTTLAASQDGGSVTSRVQVAELGSFWDPRYGDFEISGDELANWQKLLGSHFHGRVPIDFDHRTDKGVSSEAGAWIIGLDQLGKDGESPQPREVWATVEWNPLGAEAVREKRYLYISPTFVDDLKDKRGKSLGPALLRAALTNAPFLSDMPAVSLSGATLAQRKPSPSPESAPGPDSRSAMEIKTLTTALGLPDDVDEAKALDAIKALKATSEDTRTLEQRAEAEGKVLLSTADHDKLKNDSAGASKALERVAAIEQERAEEKFKAAYKTCLDKGQLHPAYTGTGDDKVDETRETYKTFYDIEPAKTLAAMERLPKQVNLTARGAGGGAPPATTVANAENAPTDENRATLLDRAKALMAEDTTLTLAQAALRAEHDLAGAVA